MNPAPPSDIEQLMSRVANGDPEAFSCLYRHTSAKLYGTIVLVLGRGEDAQEALQDAFVRIWENAQTFDAARGSPIAWMATIARNRALDEARRPKPQSLEELPETFDPPAEEFDPFGEQDKSTQRAALILCLGLLAPEKRQMVLSAYYRGASREALAKRFHRPTPTIKTLLRRSLQQLKDCLTAQARKKSRRCAR